MKWLVFVFAALLVASSAPDEQAVLRGLVGDGSLGPAQIGPSEEIAIGITHWSPPYSHHLLLMLTPDRVLTVGRFGSPTDEYLAAGTRDSGVERLDQVRLSPEAFAEFRRRLAVFRPETLRTDGPTIMPKGCHYVGEGGERVGIGFNAPHNQSGSFLRQSEQFCSAGRLDEAMREILATLPRTEAVAGFVW